MKLLITLSLQLSLSLAVAASAQEGSTIGLAEIEGRHWLVDPDGQPFFAHGVTHVNLKDRDYEYSDFAMACKELGFNAYGYGCPPELKGDMPYLEGRNFVPISMYRSDENAYAFRYDEHAPVSRVPVRARVKFDRSSNHE